MTINDLLQIKAFFLGFIAPDLYWLQQWRHSTKDYAENVLIKIGDIE